MYRFFASSLRAVAAILVPCGILATLTLPRAHGGVGGAVPVHRQDYSAALLAKGLPFVIIRPNGRIAMASRSARRLFGLGLSGGNLLNLTAGTEAQEALRRAIHSPFERMEYIRVAFPGCEEGQRLYRMESTPMAEAEATGIVLRDVTDVAHEVSPTAHARMAAAASSMAGPISVLSGWLETAQETGTTLTPIALRAMERQVELLKELTAGMGAEQGNSSLLLGDIDLVPIIQQAADCLATRMIETGSQLELNYAETPFLLRGDASLWKQLVGHLLASMLRWPDARQLRLTAERHGHEAVIEIVSDGPASWETTPGGRSRLELVHAAVRAQHGEFAYDTTPGSGTCYRLTFPA